MRSPFRSPRFGPRPSSIKTRIKTSFLMTFCARPDVRDHLPLKQGLRLSTVESSLFYRYVRDHLPLKQGLRRECLIELPVLEGPRPSSIKTRIKTYIKCRIEFFLGPRPSSIKTRIKTLQDYEKLLILIRDHLPLKQGLRREGRKFDSFMLVLSETIFH